MKEPTRQKILQVIKQFTAQHGIAPTLTELAAAVDIRSRSNVLFHLRKLEADGLIARSPQTHRGITLVNSPAVDRGMLESDLQIPLRGIVAASHAPPRVGELSLGAGDDLFQPPRTRIAFKLNAIMPGDEASRLDEAGALVRIQPVSP